MAPYKEDASLSDLAGNHQNAINYRDMFLYTHFFYSHHF